MNSSLTFTVIICAYTENRWDDLVAAVASIEQQQLTPSQIIIVIDHNAALYYKARHQFCDLIVLKNQHQQGLSGARNSGIEKATGDVIAFMDEDAEAMPNWLETLANSYSAKNILGVGGSINPSWMNGRPSWFPKEFDWVVGCTYLGMPEQPAPVRNLIGCNMSFRKAVLVELGGFQEDMGRIGTKPLGCEETEFCIRIHQNWPKAVLLFQPEAAVLHRVPSTRGRWHYFKSRCYSEGISKAQVALHRGQKDALSNERHYTFHTLPKGVFQGISESLRTQKIAGLLRAMAINLGLVYTILGYAMGRLSFTPTSRGIS